MLDFLPTVRQFAVANLWFRNRNFFIGIGRDNLTANNILGVER